MQCVVFEVNCVIFAEIGCPVPDPLSCSTRNASPGGVPFSLSLLLRNPLHSAQPASRVIALLKGIPSHLDVQTKSVELEGKKKKKDLELGATNLT